MERGESVRSTSITGNSPPPHELPGWANSGLMHRSKMDLYSITSSARPAAAKAIAAARDGKIKPACFVSQEDGFSVSRSPLIETRPPNFRATTQSQPRRPRGNRRQMSAMWESA